MTTTTTTRPPRPRRRSALLLACAPLLAAAGTPLLPGCGSAPRAREGPYSPLTDADRNGDLARRLTQQAAGLMDTDPERAEALLREALNADL